MMLSTNAMGQLMYSLYEQGIKSVDISDDLAIELLMLQYTEQVPPLDVRDDFAFIDGLFIDRYLKIK